jgi:2'-5' RNA ligase
VAAERARLFAALEVPAMVRAALEEWRSQRLARVPGLRATKPEALHVTLCFLGWQPVEEIESIASACAVLAGRGRPLLSLGKPLWLPNRRPRVVAVALEDRRRRLADLQSELAAALHAGGWYEPEQRPFRAHVTLARASGGARLAPIEMPGPAPIRFLGSIVVLWRSRPHRAGTDYERLSKVSLRPGAQR